MSSTIAFATQSAEEASNFVGSHSDMKLIIVKSTDVLELWKDGEEQEPWYSNPGGGVGNDWILILATHDEVVMPKTVPASD